MSEVRPEGRTGDSPARKGGVSRFSFNPEARRTGTIQAMPTSAVPHLQRFLLERTPGARAHARAPFLSALRASFLQRVSETDLQI